MSVHPHNAEPPLSQDELKATRKLVQDYQNLNLVSRTLWRFIMIVCAFLVGLAAFMASMKSYFSNPGMH